MTEAISLVKKTAQTPPLCTSPGNGDAQVGRVRGAEAVLAVRLFA
jgi:hypothetical protein